MKKSILILDADLRATLSIVRSIGSLKKYHIYVAGCSNFDLCRFSRYTDSFHKYYPPTENSRLFIDSLRKLIEVKKPDYIFPCSDVTLFPIYMSELYEEIEDKLIGPNKESYLKSFDKKMMNEIARSSSVKVIEDISDPSSHLPIVIKPRQSWFMKDGHLVSGFRKMVHHDTEIDNAFNEIQVFDNDPLIQKKITGKGYGVFAAAKDGEIFASFAHERIRETPPEGGVSTLRKSIKVNPVLLESSKRIVRKLQWTGIIMVEFKGETEEDAYFMEVNGRPWGSLDLAVCSGVDFPKMMCDLYINDLNINELTHNYKKPYKSEVHSRWIIGELKYIGQMLTSKKTFKEKWHEIKKVFFRSKNESYDTFRLTDPLPLLGEFTFYLMKSLKLLKSKFINR